MKQLPQWRTWWGELILGAMMVLSLAICRDAANGPALLPVTITGLGGLGLWLAGKSAKEHSANAAAKALAGQPEVKP